MYVQLLSDSLVASEFVDGSGKVVENIYRNFSEFLSQEDPAFLRKYVV